MGQDRNLDAKSAAFDGSRLGKSCLWALLQYASDAVLKDKACHFQGDAEKVRLRGAALTREEEVACAARWRADCERYAVERAGFWMSGPSSAQGALSGAATADAAPAQQLAEVPGGSGYVNLGGVPVPSRGAQRGPMEARQFVRTPTAEQNLQACALVLCQRRPLLLDGPPGAPMLTHMPALTCSKQCAA